MKAIDNKELVIAMEELEKERGIEKTYLLQSIEQNTQTIITSVDTILFEEEFLKGIEPFGIQLDCRYQGEMYRSGKYAKYVIHAIKHRKEIFDIPFAIQNADKLKSVANINHKHHNKVNLS